jgi:DnaK suppressor protein
MAAKTATKKSVKKPVKKVVKAAKKVVTKLVGKAVSKKKEEKPVSKAKSQAVKKTPPKKIVTKTKSITKKDELSKVMPKKKLTKTEKVVTPAKEEKKIVEPAVVQKPQAVQHHEQPKKPIKGYSKKDLEHFRTIILEKRDEIIEQLQNLKEQMLDPTTGEYINENSPYSLHMAEQGTDAMEREKIFLYAQRENKFLGYLEDALKRIDSGTYGICIECIDEPQHLCDTCPLIPKARLEAVPHSQLCLQIKQKQEKK